MRSVQVFPAMDWQHVTAMLDELGERRGSEWFGIAGRRIEVSAESYESVAQMFRAIARDGASSSELDQLRVLEDQLAGIWVEVRVSGRGDVQAEMRELVIRLLDDGGCATDDSSNRVWSVDEIRRDSVSDRAFRA